MTAEKRRGSWFAYQTFLVFFGVLLLVSGIHTGLIVAANRYQWPTAVQILVPMLYWALIAAGLTAYVRSSVKRNYEIPFRQVSEAAARLAKGDFSARLAPVADSEVAAYLDSLMEDFNKMAEELANVETLRTDFVANVSHELKTPLAVIQNYGTMLQQPDLEETQRVEYAKAVTAASRRMADLITNILKLNKLENQQICPQVRTYDLGEQLCECLLNFEEAWERKRLEIETEIEDGVLVNTDPELLSLVWSNLFSNAIKFTEEGGTVRLSLRAVDGWAEVAVSDTGCGMSPETGRHIFDKFYQGDTSHATQGNGLGLALVKRIIDIVTGEIRVESTLGKGSTFTVRLPRIRNEEG